MVQAYGEAWKPVDTVMLLMQVALLLLFLAGLATGGTRGVLPGLLVAVFCASHMLVVCRMRYLVPLMPVVMVVGAAFLDRMLPRAPRS